MSVLRSQKITSSQTRVAALATSSQSIKLQAAVRVFLRWRLFNFLVWINSKTFPQTQCFVGSCWNHGAAIWRHSHVQYTCCVAWVTQTHRQQYANKPIKHYGRACSNYHSRFFTSVTRWHSGRLLDLGSIGRRFESQLPRCQVQPCAS